MFKLVIVNNFMGQGKFFELFYNDLEICSGAYTEYIIYKYKDKIGVDMHNGGEVVFLTTDIIEYEEGED